MNVAELEKLCAKILKLLKIENEGIRCQFLVMTEAEWISQRKQGYDTMDVFFGFTLVQSYSCLVKICESLISKMNLSQLVTKWRLGTIMKDALTDSKETMGKLYEFMGNDPNAAEDDRYYGTLLLNTLDSLIRGARYILQKKELGKQMLMKEEEFLEGSTLLEDLPIRVVWKQNMKTIV